MTMAAFDMVVNKPAHVTVMRDEVVKGFSSLETGLVIDVTAGYGGHSEALLRAKPNLSVIGFDRDLEAVRSCRARLEQFGDRAQIVHAPFSQLRNWLAREGLNQIDGLIGDLGVSSPQVDRAGRGFSFRTAGPLDMRMDTSSGETALELIERLSQEELADVIYQLGEERRSRRVAACIKQALITDELVTTLDLRKAVIRAVGPRRIGGVDPATRTFQALRIAVNRELEELASLLGGLHEIVRPGGVAALISFHSLEDRLVKRCFQERALWKRASSKPAVPGEAELDENPRSRSAKLRVARRTTLMQVPRPLPEGVDPREFHG
jgi:16S rRNA (cytosine1402-N4)-methyltransferase